MGRNGWQIRLYLIALLFVSKTLADTLVNQSVLWFSISSGFCMSCPVPVYFLSSGS